MLNFITRKLALLLVIAAVTSCVSALLAVSLFGMVAQSKRSLFPPFDPFIYAGLWCALVAVSIGAAALLSRHSTRAVFEVRTTLIRRILSTEYDRLEKVGTARLHNVLAADVTAVANTLADLPTLIFNAILLICCLTYLAILSIKVFAVIAAAIGVVFLVSKTLIGSLARHGKIMRERQDFMQESYKGMLAGGAQLAVDANRKSFHYHHDLLATATALRESEQRFRFFWDTNRSMTSALILLLLGVLVATGRMLADASMVMSYTLIVIYCAGPFAAVMNVLQQFTQAKVALRKIESLKIAQDQPVAPCRGGRLEWSSIRLSEIAFVYESGDADEPFSLGPITLKVHKGEVIFITGGNGSGKSTFVKLLLGLHQATAGKIFVDEAPVDRQGNLPAYQALFSIVLSEFHLFRHVLGGDGNLAKDQDLAELLEMFNLASVVRIENGCFSTVRLSQGQRKRLALVAALAEDKDIYVLDEWAADQDPHYRKVFYREIIPWMRRKGKTVIAVTHDDRYFDAADRCIEFEMGKIRSGADMLPAPQSARPIAIY